MSVVSESEASSFRSSGAVLLRSAFSPSWVEAIRSGIEANLAAPSNFSQSVKGDGEEGGAYFNDYFNWREIPEFRSLVYDSPAAEIAAKLMGERERYGG